MSGEAEPVGMISQRRHAMRRRLVAGGLAVALGPAVDGPGQGGPGRGRCRA